MLLQRLLSTAALPFSAVTPAYIFHIKIRRTRKYMSPYSLCWMEGKTPAFKKMLLSSWAFLNLKRSYLSIRSYWAQAINRTPLTDLKLRSASCFLCNVTLQLRVSRSEEMIFTSCKVKGRDAHFLPIRSPECYIRVPLLCKPTGGGLLHVSRVRTERTSKWNKDAEMELRIRRSLERRHLGRRVW